MLAREGLGRGSANDPVNRIAKAAEEQNKKLDKLIENTGPRGHGFTGDINLKTISIA